MKKLNVAISAVVMLSLCGNGNTDNLFGNRWLEPTMIMFVDIDGADGLWNRAFEEAMAEWSQETVFDFSIKRRYRDPCDNFNGFNGVGFNETFCGDLWDDKTLAVTTGLVDQDGFLVERDIVFNSSLSWNVYSGPIQSTAAGGNLNEFKRVALHELGHVIGLGHSDQPLSIMKAHMSSIETISELDVSTVNAQYDDQPKIEFIERFYRNILRRDSDPGGLAFWVNKIKTESAAFVAVGFFQSREFFDTGLNNGDFVRILYLTVFDREPDSGGFDFWVDQLDRGANRQTIINRFLDSIEFSNLAFAFGVSAY
ncbi:MAG: DUF4214 domain-containing protein [Methylococcales bacterium]